MQTPSFERLTAQWPDLAIVQAKRIESVASARAWLQGLDVDDQPLLRSPLTVFRDREATPLDGALWACAVLRHVGHPPRLLVLLGPDGLHAAALVETAQGWQAVVHHRDPQVQLQDESFGDATALASALAARLDGGDGSSVQWCVLALEAYDAYDWMGDDNQVGEVLAAVEAALIGASG
jgi:hypothetical protein